MSLYYFKTLSGIDIRLFCNTCFVGIVRQSELFALRQHTAQWTPPPAVLDEEDLRRAEEEALAAVTVMRAGDDKVHASRLLNLKETLSTIREGGAARLKADKDAAAVGGKAFLLLRFPDSHPSSIVRARSLSVALGSGSTIGMPRCILG